MSILLIDVSRKIKACRFARTLGSSERLTEQLIKLKEYADRHGIAVTDTILDYSGGSEIDRIKIEELYEGVENGRYEAVLVTHSDRIANNPKDVEMFCKRIEGLGGIVYSLAEGYLSFHNR